MHGLKALTILAIDPGTRHMGVAVLDGSDLIFATVKAVKVKGLNTGQALKKAQAIISHLIAAYNPDVLTIEKNMLIQTRTSPPLAAMTRAIRQLAKRKRLAVYECDPARVRRFICQSGKTTKMKAASIIVDKHYPWLRRYLEKDRKKRWWEEKYWAGMFDAIALGLFCQSLAGECSRGQAA